MRGKTPKYPSQNRREVPMDERADTLAASFLTGLFFGVTSRAKA